MPLFIWEGTNTTGKVVTGEIEAKDALTVFNVLRAQNILPNAQKIKEKGKGMDFEIKIPGFGGGVSGKDLVIFTRQFATMVDAGLPIVRAIGILAENSENKVMKKALFAIKEDVETGKTLGDSLAQQNKVFDELFVNMIRAGEDGGILDTILDRLATQIEKTTKLKREVKTAMIYPAVVVSAAVIVTTVLLVFVIPTFAEMFLGMGGELPLPTQIVINMSNFMVNYWYLILGTAGGVITFFIKSLKTKRGKEIIHPIFLRLPVFGNIIRKVAVARFSRTLGTMLSSGVPILDALYICSKTAGNYVVERDVQSTRVAISEGKSIIEPLGDSDVFPPMVTSMIGVGESTGELDAMLSKIADFYEDEVDNAVGAMKQLIEPLMILMLGVIIGGLVISMYLPIFKMGSLI